MIRIYGKKKSRAMRCLWTLEELGLAYEHIAIDQDKGENRSPAYLALNPGGKIPTLVDGDFVLTESMAINIYLAGLGPNYLLPSDPRQLAAVMQWTFWAATEVESQVMNIVREFRRGLGNVDQQRVTDSLATLTATVQLLETHLHKRGPYLLGGQFTMADLNTAAVLFYLGLVGFKLEKFPLTAAWLDLCLSRPAWKKLQD